jgi:outer membrane protein W
MQLKKIIAILVIFVCVGTVLSAQDFGISFGGGALLDWNFGNGVRTTYGKKAPELYDRKDGDTDYSGVRNMSFGAYAFLDVTYAEIDVSFAYGSLTGVARKNKDTPTTGGDASMLQLGFTLLGKYPVKMGQITVFPLLGIGYNMVLSTDPKGTYGTVKVIGSDGKEKEVERKMSDLNQFSFLGGGGLDYNINRNLYLRFSALAQLRFASKATRDGINEANDYASWRKKDFDEDNDRSLSTVLGIGPVIRVGFGYRF